MTRDPPCFLHPEKAFLCLCRLNLHSGMKSAATLHPPAWYRVGCAAKTALTHRSMDTSCLYGCPGVSGNVMLAVDLWIGTWGLCGSELQQKADKMCRWTLFLSNHRGVAHIASDYPPHLLLGISTHKKGGGGGRGETCCSARDNGGVRCGG